MLIWLYVCSAPDELLRCMNLQHAHITHQSHPHTAVAASPDIKSISHHHHITCLQNPSVLFWDALIRAVSHYDLIFARMFTHLYASSLLTHQQQLRHWMHRDHPQQQIYEVKQHKHQGNVKQDEDRDQHQQQAIMAYVTHVRECVSDTFTAAWVHIHTHTHTHTHTYTHT